MPALFSDEEKDAIISECRMAAEQNDVSASRYLSKFAYIKNRLYIYKNIF